MKTNFNDIIFYLKSIKKENIQSFFTVQNTFLVLFFFTAVILFFSISIQLAQHDAVLAHMSNQNKIILDQLNNLEYVLKSANVSNNNAVILDRLNILDAVLNNINMSNHNAVILDRLNNLEAALKIVNTPSDNDIILNRLDNLEEVVLTESKHTENVLKENVKLKKELKWTSLLFIDTAVLALGGCILIIFYKIVSS